MLVVVMLAFAAGLSVGFVQGRIFERIEWQHRFDKFVEKHGGKDG